MNRVISRIIISAILINFCYSQSLGQDLIVLKSGQEYPVKIISKKGPSIKYTLWDKVDNKSYLVDKKLVKRYLMEYLMKERVSMSFSLGGSSFGTSKQLNNYLIDKRYNQRVNFPILWNVSYPISDRRVSWKIDLEYLFKIPHGISVEFGQLNSGSIQGYNGRDYTPKLIFSNPQLSVNYKYYFKNLRSFLQTGVIINNAIIKEEDNGFQFKDSKISPGFLLGFATSIVEKRVFFFRLEAQYRYVFPIEFSNSSLFLNNMQIRLSHLFIGVQFGIKFYPKKNKRGL